MCECERECVCAALGALGQRKNKQKQSRRRRDSFSYLLLSEKASGSIPGCGVCERASVCAREQVSQ